MMLDFYGMKLVDHKTGKQLTLVYFSWFLTRVFFHEREEVVVVTGVVPVIFGGCGGWW